MPLSPETKQTLLAAGLAMLLPTAGAIGGIYVGLDRVDRNTEAVKALQNDLKSFKDNAPVWAVLAENSKDITTLKRFMTEMERLTHPEEVREWGYIKKTVPENKDHIQVLTSKVIVLEVRVDDLEDDDRR